MTRPLTGAAKTAQHRRILIDEARDLMAQRPHVASLYIVGLLVAADAKAPRKAPAQRFDQCDATCTTDCGHCKGRAKPALVVSPGSTMTRADVRLLPLTGPQAGWQ